MLVLNILKHRECIWSFSIFNNFYYYTSHWLCIIGPLQLINRSEPYRPIARLCWFMQMRWPADLVGKIIGCLRIFCVQYVICHFNEKILLFLLSPVYLLCKLAYHFWVCSQNLCKWGHRAMGLYKSVLISACVAPCTLNSILYLITDPLETVRPSLTDHWSNVLHAIYADVDIVFDFFCENSKTPYFPLQIVVFTVGIPYPLREAKSPTVGGFTYEWQPCAAYVIMQVINTLGKH